MSASASDSRTRDSRSPSPRDNSRDPTPTQRQSSNGRQPSNDVNNLSQLLASTVGLVNHLCLDTDPTHVKPASHLLRTIVVRHSTTTTTVVGPSDVLILSATDRIVVLTTTHDRTTHALLTSVLVHLLLSIVDSIPALRPVAVVLDATFVEVSIAIHAITVHNPVTVGRTSIFLLLQ